MMFASANLEDCVKKCTANTYTRSVAYSMNSYAHDTNLYRSATCDIGLKTSSAVCDMVDEFKKDDVVNHSTGNLNKVKVDTGNFINYYTTHPNSSHDNQGYAKTRINR